MTHNMALCAIPLPHCHADCYSAPRIRAGSQRASLQASFTPTPPLRCLMKSGRGVFPQCSPVRLAPPAHPPDARPPFHPQGGTAHHAPLLSSLIAQTHACLRQVALPPRSCVPHSRGHRPLLWLAHASHRTLADSLLSASGGRLLSSFAGQLSPCPHVLRQAIA